MAEKLSEDIAPTPTEVIGGEFAPTIFIDGMQGFVFDGYNIRLRLTQTIANLKIPENTTETKQRVEATLVMNYRTFMQVKEFFDKVVRDMNRASASVEEVNANDPAKSASPDGIKSS